ncbi:hypothetical protein QBC35DRAFT_452139 [Podospora australis]|uniref:Uncharacterized protein n=1 Tax=Podospora australis TaxID=1536484 RepID=A0AAN7AHN6_9PEZI|nr:hypothetical protein QBC35DRAFT_452139 [Podospora australis]
MLRLPPSTITLNITDVKQLIERRNGSKHRRQFLRYLQEKAPREATEVIHTPPPPPPPPAPDPPQAIAQQEQLRLSTSRPSSPRPPVRTSFDYLEDQEEIEYLFKLMQLQSQNLNGQGSRTIDLPIRDGRLPEMPPLTPPRGSPEFMRSGFRNVDRSTGLSNDGHSGTPDSVDGVADMRFDTPVREPGTRSQAQTSVRRRLHPDERPIHGHEQPTTPSRLRTPGSFRVYDDFLPPSIQPRTPQHLPEARHQSRLRGSYTAPPVRSSPGLTVQTPITARQRREMRAGSRNWSPPGVQTPGMMGLYGGFENTDDEVLFEEIRRHGTVRRPRSPY